MTAAPTRTDRPPRTRARRWGIRALRALAITYVCWCGVLYFVQDDLLFPRGHTRRVLPDEKIPKEIEHWWLDATGPDGKPVRVEAYFLPAEPLAGVGAEAQAGGPAGAPLAVYFHGNADSLDRCRDSAQPWRDRGFNVLIPEYRGYGRCGGKPSQESIVADATAFVDRALARPEVDRTRVVYHGWSLGSGVAAQVALARRPRAIVIQAGFSSVAAFAWGYGVPPFLVRSPFRSDEALREMTSTPATGSAPGTPRVLILHSRDDEIVPWSHSERLRRAVPDAAFFELHGSHTSDIAQNEEVWAWIDGQLREAGMTVETER